ncbi:MAG: hypothetical protein IKK24_07360, partial [Clostridia bacterium]|nr:hypothetical protein [Clostridia bacterium]
FNTYLNITKLIEYSKRICPDAEIMLHETWSWGVWNDNGDERCYKIMANYLAASKFLCENATVIHSGLAIEKVREQYNDHRMLNDVDNGNYQHLNSLGKYIAGAAYVATIFGGDFTANTYGNGESVFAALDLGVVRGIIADAVKNGNTEINKKYEDYLAQLYDKIYGEPDNFIDRHLSKAEGIVQDVATGDVDANERFGAAVANSGSSVPATDIAIDGDTVATFDVWGALDWDPPKNVGVRYTLDGTYKVYTAEIYVGKASDPVTVDVYAGKAGDSSLYSKENLVGESIVCKGEKVTVDIDAEITDIAFIVTSYTNAGNTFHVAEFDLTGSDDKVSDNEGLLPGGPGGGDKENTNFIAKHLGSFGGIVEDVKTGAVDANERFGASVADSGSPLSAEELAIDGDTATTFDVWGALDWDPPKNVGVRYALDAIYRVDTAVIYAGNSSHSVTVDVYAAKIGGPALYQESNLVGKGIVCSGGKVTVDIGFEITEIAFIFTDYNKAGNTLQIAEFDLTGSDVEIPKEEFKWPEVPDGKNILKNATAFEIIAPGGDFRSSKEYDYGFMDYKTETKLDKLVDGNTEQHYDIWSLRDGDKPGVLYDLGAYYDITHLHAWAGVFESDLYLVNGYRMYASDSLSTLYQDENAVFVHENDANTTNEAGADVNLKKVRYIAFIITKESGGWKLRELAAYGAKSADQSQPAERESIIAGLDAEYYGVATDNLYDPIYMGASEDVTALVDGKRENVEFWGGNDVNNSCFVFIYNLYANYDLSDLEIFTNGDYMDTEFNVHKGIKSAKVYASRKFDGLFSTTPIVLKDGYAKEGVADEVSSFAADARSEWKAVRYVAFVFTIDDTQYGACRLEELKVYGKMSAVQDAPEEEVRLPQYIDIKAENGVIARIFAMNSSDDLSKLDAHLDSSRSTDKSQLGFINNALKGYNAKAIYSTVIVDSNGNKVDTDGRFIRLSLPKESGEQSVACVDDFGAEIVSNGVLNEFLTVETSTLRSYALVAKTAEALAGNAAAGINLLWIGVIVSGVIALIGITLSVLFGIKMRKS